MNLRTRVVGGLCLAAALAPTACVNDDSPAIARIIIEATPAVPLQLVTSTNFEAVRNQDGARSPVLLVADTSDLADGYDQEVALGVTGRVFIQVRNVDIDPETVRMRVLLDSRVDFDVTGELETGEFLQYMYTSLTIG